MQTIRHVLHELHRGFFRTQPEPRRVTLSMRNIAYWQSCARKEYSGPVLRLRNVRLCFTRLFRRA